MKHIHIGHHFYGSGNVGDDFMLAGFLLELSKKPYQVSISCCIPYELNKIKSRFPQINWLPYTQEAREACIKTCDVWLGLGGSPFQNSVSTWFIDHLAIEHSLALKFSKPMAFLGIGSQDDEAFANKDLIRIIDYSEFISTRDTYTYKNLLSKKLLSKKISLGADLGHLFLSKNLPRDAVKGRLSTILNSDYKQWPNLNSLVTSLDDLKASEQIWLIQESRKLPGSEQSLFESLPYEIKAKWKPIFAEQSASPLSTITSLWPTSEWTLTSRYHAAIVSFWGGSKPTILGLNKKLESLANEFGLEALPIDSPNKTVLKSLSGTKPIDRSILIDHTNRAKISVDNFCRTFGI